MILVLADDKGGNRQVQLGHWPSSDVAAVPSDLWCRGQKCGKKCSKDLLLNCFSHNCRGKPSDKTGKRVMVNINKNVEVDL